MKKLLYFASDFKIGLSQLLVDQLVSIHRAGVEYIAVAGEKEQELGLADMLSREGITLTRIQGLDTHAKFNHLVSEISSIIKNENIVVVHCQNNWQLAITAVAKLRCWPSHKIKIAYTLHGFRNNIKWKSFIARGVIGSLLLVSADYVICMTEYLKRKFSLLSYKILLIPLGVNNDFFNSDFINPPDESLRLIFPAQFREGKNQDIIIQAFADYITATNDQNSILVLPGTGSLLAKAKELTEKLGIRNLVEFPGRLTKEQVKNEYLKSNIAIVASNSETFGQSIVEPYVLGRCVISTPVGIASEIIKNGINGYIFHSRDDLKALLIEISKHKYRLNEIGKMNYNHRDLFSWSNITNQYIRKLNLK